MLTYPLWCLGQLAIEDWGWTGLSKYGIQKYFNRSFILCAIAGVLMMRPRFGASGERFVSSNFERSSLVCVGLVLGTAAFAVLMAAGFGFSCIAPSGGRALVKVAGKALLAAVVVGYLEEWLFRKHFLNAICHRFGLSVGQVLLAVLFASVHFLKPVAPPAGLEVDGWVGFRLLPMVFHQYSNLTAILGGWLTLFALGMLLSRLAIGSGVIWPAVGVHVAVIFWNKVLSSQFAVQQCKPWFAGNFQTGLVPLMTLGVMAVWAAEAVRIHPAPKDSELRG
jgi:membrane protease YdiL (CAAX protease family)